MKVLGIFTAVAISVLYGGYVLSMLWNWHITPLGVGSINIAHGIGIYSVVGMMTKSPSDKEIIKDEDLLKAFIGTFVFTSMFFLYGYMAYLFMS